MRQDNDVARMAAALRTPSLRYRSFGNDPVRQGSPREPEAPAEFPLLGEALAGIEALPPDVRMTPADVAPPPEPVYYEPPLPEPMPVAPPSVQVAPPPPVLPSVMPLVAQPVPTVVAPRPEASPPVIPSAASTVPPPASPAPSLLQALMAQPPVSAPDLPPLVVGRYPPQDPVPAPAPAPVTVAAAPRVAPPAPPSAGSPILAPPGWTRAPEPILPSAPAFLPSRGLVAAPPMPRLLDEEPHPVVTRPTGSGSGSSLLDTLIGVGASPATAAQYPLLDSLSVAMKTDGGDPTTRLWPAARVEMALPELLRRVAAGVRASRGTA